MPVGFMQHRSPTWILGRIDDPRADVTVEDKSAPQGEIVEQFIKSSFNMRSVGVGYGEFDGDFGKHHSSRTSKVKLENDRKAVRELLRPYSLLRFLCCRGGRDLRIAAAPPFLRFRLKSLQQLGDSHSEQL